MRRLRDARRARAQAPEQQAHQSRDRTGDPPNETTSSDRRPDHRPCRRRRAARRRRPRPVPAARWAATACSQLVGRGGMGEVYAAHDPELDRKVADQDLRADTYADDVESARLLREAQ